MFTSRPRLAVNPFNPNTLPTNTRRTLPSSFIPPPFLPFLYCMSNLPSEPISRRVRRVRGVRGVRGSRTVSVQIHFCSRSRLPRWLSGGAAAERGWPASGRGRRTESRVYRALFISSLLKPGRGVNLMTQA